MPQLQGLDIRILLCFREGFLFQWSEMIDADPISAKAILQDLKNILLSGYTTDNEYLQRLETTRDRIVTFKQGHKLSHKANDLVNTLLNDIKESIDNTKQFPGYVPRFVKTEGQILTKRQVVAIELLTDSRFIKISQFFSNQKINNFRYEYFFSKLYEVAESGDPAGEAQLLDALDKVVFYGSFFLQWKQKRNPKSEEIKQHLDYVKTLPGKLYQPGWLSSALAILLGGLSNFIMFLIFYNPIATLLASAYTRNTDFLITTLKYPVYLFTIPMLGAQFGWHNGLRSLFSQLQLGFPTYLNRFTFASLAIIGLAVTSALLITFFPPAAPFILGLPALGFLTSLSMPLLATVVGVTVGLVLTVIATLATVAMRPSKNKRGYIALHEGATAQPSTAAATTTSSPVTPAVHPAMTSVASPSAAARDAQANAGSILSTSKPVFSPVQENMVNLRIRHDNGCLYRDMPISLIKGNTYESDKVPFSVMFKQDGTFYIDIKDLKEDDNYSIVLNDGKTEIALVENGKLKDNLPQGIVCLVTNQQQPAPQP